VSFNGVFFLLETFRKCLHAIGSDSGEKDMCIELNVVSNSKYWKV
jgi:hypothetical protein